MFDGMLKKMLGADINDERALEILVSRHIENLTREEAMRVIHAIKEWADEYGKNVFGPRSWSEFCERKKNEKM